MYNLVIVDDEKMARSTLERAFDWSGMGFHIAASFADAQSTLVYLDTKEGESTDTLLIDIRLGGMSGLDLAEAIRTRELDVRIVFISAYREFEYARQAVWLGGFDYIVKPVTSESVISTFTALKTQLDEDRGVSAIPVGGAESLIDRACRYIDAHCVENISLEDVARYVALNPVYFSRFFKEQSGTKFSDHLSRARIQKACALLADPTMRIYEICQSVGYRNKKHFTHLFRAHTGCTPTEYRERVTKRNGTVEG